MKKPVLGLLKKLLRWDRTVNLINKYGDKLGRFSKKYTDIKNALEKNILFILNIKKEENEQ